MPAIVAALSALARWLAPYLVTLVISAFGVMFSDTLLGLVGQFFSLFSNSVTNTTVTLPSVSTSFAGLPPEMLGIMKRIRLDDAFAIILSAVGVRAVASMFSFIRAARRGVAP